MQKAIFLARTERQQKEDSAENQKLLDCEMEFNARRNSFNSENYFFSVSPFRLALCVLPSAAEMQLALAQAPFFSLCFSGFLCMDDDGGRKACQEKLLHFPILFPLNAAAAFCWS